MSTYATILVPHQHMLFKLTLSAFSCQKIFMLCNAQFLYFFQFSAKYYLQLIVKNRFNPDDSLHFLIITP